MGGDPRGQFRGDRRRAVDAAVVAARGFRVDWRRPPMLIGAAAGLIADVVLKTLLAPAWQRLLLRIVTPEGDGIFYHPERTRSVIRRTSFLLMAALCGVGAFAAGPATRPDAHAGFDGIWNSATVTPLERPAQLKDKAVLHAGRSGGLGAPGRREQSRSRRRSRGARKAPAPAPTTPFTASSAPAPSRPSARPSSPIRPTAASPP